MSNEAIAFLTPLTDSVDSEDLMAYSMQGEEVTIGSDAALAVIRLDEPSVAPLHARLTTNDKGTISLMDKGSIAGTWLNYTLVPPEGCTLTHGDLIHFGRVGFRFTYREPKHIPQLVILEEDWRK